MESLTLFKMITKRRRLWNTVGQNILRPRHKSPKLTNICNLHVTNLTYFNTDKYRFL